MNNIDSKTLIKKIKTAYQIATNPELANQLGLTVSAIEQWSKKNKVPEKYIFKCIKDTGVSMEYLLNKENDDKKDKKINYSLNDFIFDDVKKASDFKKQLKNSNIITTTIENDKLLNFFETLYRDCEMNNKLEELEKDIKDLILKYNPKIDKATEDLFFEFLEKNSRK